MMTADKPDTQQLDSLKALLWERLEAKGWSRYRLAQEFGAIREQKSYKDVTASTYSTVVNKCMSDPGSAQVKNLWDIAQALDITFHARITEFREVPLS